MMIRGTMLTCIVLLLIPGAHVEELNKVLGDEAPAATEAAHEEYTYTFASTHPHTDEGEKGKDGEKDKKHTTKIHEFTFTYELPSTEAQIEPCLAGDYMTDSGCQKCGENTFSGDGATSCTSCPDGKVSAAGSRSTADCHYAPCSAGSFMTDNGCKECKKNTYSGDAATSCTRCPRGQESPIGSTSIEDCKFLEACPEGKIHCADGLQCIDNWRQCDGDSDCKDGSDESDSVCRGMTCPVGTITCADNQTCISTRGMCDGRSYCPDGSDEDAEFCKGYTCPKGQSKCGDDLKCVNKWKMCDGKEDCKDGSDESEEFCGAYTCPAAKAKCGDGLQCVVIKKQCDGKAECNDGSDESPELCQAPCEAGFHMTDDGCEQCGENTFSAYGASSCTSCSEGKVSKPGSTSALDCEYDDGEEGSDGKGGRGKGKGKGKGRKVIKSEGGGEDESKGGGRRRGRGKGKRKKTKDEGDDPDVEDPDVEDPDVEDPDVEDPDVEEDLTDIPVLTTSFTTSAGPVEGYTKGPCSAESTSEEDCKYVQLPTCSCWTPACGYCTNMECTVKQDLDNSYQGIIVRSHLKRDKFNTIVLFDKDGQQLGKLQWSLSRLFLTGCISCPTPLALKRASKGGYSTWALSLKNGILKIRMEGEIMYQRILRRKCEALYRTATSFAFSDMNCESTFSFVPSEMEAGKMITSSDCGGSCSDEQ